MKFKQPRLVLGALLSLSLVAGALASDRAVTTSIKDVYPIAHWLDGVDQHVKPVPAASFDLAPGYYRMTIQSYCLHAGAYAPTKGDGYLLAPLKGDRANLIRHILQRSAAHLDVSQQDVQRLIWGIEADASFRDYPPDFQARVSPLLTPEEMATMSAEKSAKSALGRFIPSGAKRALDFYGDLRNRVTDARLSYQQLEDFAVKNGVAPEGKDSRRVDPGNWNYEGDGFYARTFPVAYPTTVIELLVPGCYVIERDPQGRIRSFQSGPFSIDVDYDSAPAFNGRAWRIRSLSYSGPAGRFQQSDPGWIVSSAAASYSGGRRASLSAIPANQSVLAPANSARGFFSPNRTAADEVDDRIAEARGLWDSLDRYRAEWKRGSTFGGETDLTDLTHFLAALSHVSSQGRNQAFDEFYIRVLVAWVAANGSVCGDLSSALPSEGDCRRLLDPTAAVSTPGNTAKQRLGLSVRLKQ